MNKVILMGRLTRDPEVRYTQGDNSLCIANFSIAVDRRYNRNNQDGAEENHSPLDRPSEDAHILIADSGEPRPHIFPKVSHFTLFFASAPPALQLRKTG